MYSNTSLSSLCRQHIHPFKTITRTLLFIVSLLAWSSCSQLGQGSASKPTPTPKTFTSGRSLLSPTPAGSANPLRTIHMIDATTGWATTNTSLLRTTNGWRTWKDVTPHQAALVGAGYFLTGSEAWIGEASGLSLQAGQKPAVIVSHTTDGGQTWQSAALSVTVPEGVFSMSFINDQDGWSEAELGGVTGNDLVEIFRTADGGKSWTAVSDFSQMGRKTGLVFVNGTTGWATSSGLYVTLDGGATWRPQTLPGPLGQRQASGGLPTFFNAHDGLLPADSGILVTHDSGTIWQPVPESSLPPLTSLITFIDLQHGWAAASNGTALYHTDDGGAHWVKISPAIAAGITAVVQLNFVSTEVGWALGSTSEPPNTLLFTTTNGGQSWTQVPLTTTSSFSS